MSTYRRPGVYLEETVLPGPNESGVASSVTLFAGSAARGPFRTAVRCDSWTDYVARFGGYEPAAGASVSYLPYAVYSYFQNGGRICYVSRAVNDTTGSAAEYPVAGEFDSGPNEGDAGNAFTVKAASPGEWGEELSIAISVDIEAGSYSQVYTLIVYRKDSIGNDVEIERFQNLSVRGDVPGTKRVDVAVNDEVYGSRYIEVTGIDTTVTPDATAGPVELQGGADGTLPTDVDLRTAATEGAAEIEGPVVVNIVPHRRNDAQSTLVQSSIEPSAFGDRTDIFVINDAAPPRGSGETATAYASQIQQGVPLVQTGQSSSYVAAYAPWIVVNDPAVQGGTITIPPGGAVAGVYARTDATEGIFRAPAGVIASISNAVNVDARFSESDQATLNAQQQINVIRPVPGSGIAIMGGRTRKKFGVDKYVSARRTLIYIKESLKSGSSFAVFENNDERLWTRLRFTADNILRPIWSAGGLRGTSAAEAYYVICDESVNTPQVIASGEVRMEVGVALEYPAEFVVIRVSQYDGGSTAEIQT
jgi:hypothetical protein